MKGNNSCHVWCSIPNYIEDLRKATSPVPGLNFKSKIANTGQECQSIVLSVRYLLLYDPFQHYRSTWYVTNKVYSFLYSSRFTVQSVSYSVPSFAPLEVPSYSNDQFCVFHALVVGEQKAKGLESGIELWSPPYELYIVFGGWETAALEAVSGKLDR